MSTAPQESQAQEAQKVSDKELNFRKQEESFKRQIEQERQARLQAEEKVERLAQERLRLQEPDEDNDDEPYVDHKKLDKKFNKFEQRMEQKIDQKAEEKARKLLAQDREQQWMKNNPDFYEVMQHAQKFAEKDPELAESILEMPEGFERQKLVYKNIKAFGLHKKEEPKANIQDKIDANRRTPYYQPSGVGSAPYGNISLGRDISPTEGKNAYAKMQEMKNRMRLG